MGRSWLKPSDAAVMSPTDAAWLAGFFDGEGSLAAYLSRGKFPTFKMAVTNTHHGSLLKIQRLTGCGSIVVKPVSGRMRKPQWVWCLNRQRSVVAVLRQICPFAETKREVIERFLAQWTDIET